MFRIGDVVRSKYVPGTYSRYDDIMYKKIKDRTLIVTGIVGSGNYVFFDEFNGVHWPSKDFELVQESCFTLDENG